MNNFLFDSMSERFSVCGNELKRMLSLLHEQSIYCIVLSYLVWKLEYLKCLRCRLKFLTTFESISLSCALFFWTVKDLSAFLGLTPKLSRTPGGASSNATPYTPGATPNSILTDIDMGRLTPLSVQSYSRSTPSQSRHTPQVDGMQQIRPSPRQQYGNQQWNTYDQQYRNQAPRFGQFSSRQTTPQQQQQQLQDAQQYVRW